MRNGEIEKVVVGIDGSPDAKKALHWAQRYAECTEAELTLVTAWQWPSTYGVVLVLEEWDPAIDAQNTLDKARADLHLRDHRVPLRPPRALPGRRRALTGAKEDNQAVRVV